MIKKQRKTVSDAINVLSKLSEELGLEELDLAVLKKLDDAELGERFLEIVESVPEDNELLIPEDIQVLYNDLAGTTGDADDSDMEEEGVAPAKDKKKPAPSKAPSKPAKKEDGKKDKKEIKKADDADVTFADMSREELIMYITDMGLDIDPDDYEDQETLIEAIIDAEGNLSELPQPDTKKEKVKKAPEKGKKSKDKKKPSPSKAPTSSKSAPKSENKGDSKKRVEKKEPKAATGKYAKYGVHEGTKHSEHLALLLAGKSTMSEIKDATGSSCYDLIKRLNKQGFTVTKNTKVVLKLS